MVTLNLALGLLALGPAYRSLRILYSRATLKSLP